MNEEYIEKLHEELRVKDLRIESLRSENAQQAKAMRVLAEIAIRLRMQYPKGNSCNILRMPCFGHDRDISPGSLGCETAIIAYAMSEAEK